MPNEWQIDFLNDGSSTVDGGRIVNVMLTHRPTSTNLSARIIEYEDEPRLQAEVWRDDFDLLPVVAGRLIMKVFGRYEAEQYVDEAGDGFMLTTSLSDLMDDLYEETAVGSKVTAMLLAAVGRRAWPMQPSSASTAVRDSRPRQ